MLTIFKKLFNPFKKRKLEKSYAREPLFLEMLAHGLGEGHVTMIDIGSNDGLETIFALQLKGNDIDIHLLEPDPENLKTCKENIRYAYGASTKIQFHQLAISNKSVENDLFFRNPDSPHLNSATPNEQANVAVPISYVTLDAFLSSRAIESPLIIKMDIEGHEVEVLEGFLHFASSRKNIKILMEVHPNTYSDEHSLEKILKKYFEIGFKTIFVESAGLPIPKKFQEISMHPVKVIGHRGLYQNPTNDFILMAACREHLNPINDSGKMTRKIVRSILLAHD